MIADPFWFQYLPYKYLANQYEVVLCPTDSQKTIRATFLELNTGAPKVHFSYAMNDLLPTPITMLRMPMRRTRTWLT